VNLQEVEQSVRARTKGEAGTTGAKTLCMPFEQDTLPIHSCSLAEGISSLPGIFRSYSNGCIKLGICVELNFHYVSCENCRNQVFCDEQACEEVGIMGPELLIRICLSVSTRHFQ
jgi:hypothetical protein